MKRTLPLLDCFEVTAEVVVALPQLPALPPEPQLRFLELHAIRLQQLAQPLHLPFSLLLRLLQLPEDAAPYRLYIMVQLGDLHLVGSHFLPEGLHVSFDEVEWLAHGLEAGEERGLAVDDVGQADPQGDRFPVFPGRVGPSFRGEEQLIKRVHVAELGIIGRILGHFCSEQLSPLILPHRIARASAPGCVKRPRHLLHLHRLEVGSGQQRSVAVLGHLVLDRAVLVGRWSDFSRPGKHLLFTLKLLLPGMAMGSKVSEEVRIGQGFLAAV